jgi:hypothetical protein
MHKLTAKSIRFIGEQDGVPERLLKQEIIGLLQKHANVKYAYLARLMHDDSAQINVALCLVGSGDLSAISKQIGRIFGRAFNSQESLDILFLSAQQAEEILQIAAPFYLGS